MVPEALKLVAAGLIGFLSKLLLERLLQKRVNLQHELGSLRIFSSIPPAVAFQDLRITNRGNVTATNLRVLFLKKALEGDGVLFRVTNDEPFAEEVTGEIKTIVFERLLPNETREITFKSPSPLPHDFLVEVKSNEAMSSAASRGGPALRDWLGIVSSLVLAAIISFWMGSFLTSGCVTPAPSLPAALPKSGEERFLELQLTTDKLSYRQGDTAVVNCGIKNSTNELLRDLTGNLVARGFGLNFDQMYKEARFLEPGKALSWQVKITLPRNVPRGVHTISLNSWAYGGETRYSKEIRSEIRIE